MFLSFLADLMDTHSTPPWDRPLRHKKKGSRKLSFSCVSLMCMTKAITQVWRSEDNSVESVLPLNMVEGITWASGLFSKFFTY